MKTQICRVDSAEEFLSKIQETRPGEDVLHRGVSDYERFRLVPTARRSDFVKRFGHWPDEESVSIPPRDRGDHLQIESAEIDLSRKFFQLANRLGILSFDVSDQVFDWLGPGSYGSIDASILLGDRTYLRLLSLMQHFGLPTRLLDWTYNPLYAAFFAASSQASGDLIAVYSAKRYEIEYAARVVRNLEEELGAEFGCIPAFYDPPFYGNQHIVAQNGSFSYLLPVRRHHEGYSSEYDGFDAALGKIFGHHGEEIAKSTSHLDPTEFSSYYTSVVVASSGIAGSALALLDRMGVSWSTLFPTFGGIVEEIKLENGRRKSFFR